MNRKFFDLLVFSKKASEQAVRLGFERACVAGRDVEYVEGHAGLRTKNSLLTLVKPASLEDGQAAVRRREVSVLLDPVTPSGLLVDAPTLTIAKDNGVAIGFSLALLLSAQRSQQARLLHNAEKAVRLCLKKHNTLIIVSGAPDEYGARAPCDLAAVGTLLGLSEAQALWAISEAPEAILENVKT